MRLQAKLKREWRFLKGLTRTLKRVKSIAPDSDNLICDDLEAAVDKWRNNPAITFEGKTITYAELDAIANRYAHWAKGQGITRGQTVALMGSTGRSTGSHLHYEVRMDGRAVNPVPFLQSGEYVATVQSQGGVGGPTQ